MYHHHGADGSESVEVGAGLGWWPGGGGGGGGGGEKEEGPDLEMGTAAAVAPYPPPPPPLFALPFPSALLGAPVPPAPQPPLQPQARQTRPRRLFERDSSQGTATDDEASQMAQLGTGGDGGVVFEERPPPPPTPDADGAHDALPPPSDVEDALAPPSDMEGGGGATEDDDDDDEENVPAWGGPTPAAGAAAPPPLPLPPRKKALLEKSRNLRSNLRSLGKKIRHGGYSQMDDLSSGASSGGGGTDSDDDGSAGGQVRDVRKEAADRAAAAAAATSAEQDDGASAAGSRRGRASPAPSEPTAAELSSLMEEALAAGYITRDEDEAPPPPPPESVEVSVDGKPEYADPEVCYYPSLSEGEESDISLSDFEEVPRDGARAYASDGGSSLSSGASGSSYISTSASGDEADDSSFSSQGEGSEGEPDMDELIASVLAEQEEKKKARKASGRGKNGRRRKKKKKKKKRRRSLYSASGSVCSGVSLLDETIEEETDMDLRAMESSSEDEVSKKAGLPDLREDIPHESGRGSESDILNTIIETSPTKGGRAAGNPTRSPATSDSEEKPFSTFRKIATPSPRSKTNYRIIVEQDDEYYSAPESSGKLRLISPSTASLSASPESLSASPESFGYASDNQHDLYNRRLQTGSDFASPQSTDYASDGQRDLVNRHRQSRKLRFASPAAVPISPESVGYASDGQRGSEFAPPPSVGYASDGQHDLASLRRKGNGGKLEAIRMSRRALYRGLVSGGEEEKKEVTPRRADSLPPLSPTVRSVSRKKHEAQADDSSVGSTSTDHSRSSRKGEKSFRSPLHRIETYFSDSSEGSDRSSKSAASHDARIARKRRLSMNGRGGQPRTRSQPPMNRRSSRRAEKVPTTPHQTDERPASEILREMLDAVTQA